MCLNGNREQNRRREVSQALDNTIQEIRSLPGLKNFLSQPTAEDLMAEADPDPVVVLNVTRYRRDAFIIQHIQNPDDRVGSVRRRREVALWALSGLRMWWKGEWIQVAMG
jgi:hypothetical protein